MLDTQIYDVVIAETGMTQTLNELVGGGKLKILTTHIQQGEIEAIPDENKKGAIKEIHTELVTTSGAVFGVSKWGMATYGDGSAGGFGIDEVRTKSKGRTEDALIATTAARDADVIVTNDKRLANRLKKVNAKVKIWSFADLKRHIHST